VRAHRQRRAAAAAAEEINGVRIIGIDVPGFGVPTHAEAKDVLAGAMLRYARAEAEAGPVAAPRGGVSDKPTVTLLGEMFPADPVGIGMLLEPMGLAAGPVVPTREWRELYAALDCVAVAAIHPFYTASVREFEAAGRPIVPSAPVGHDGTEAWLQAIGKACSVPQAKIDAAKNKWLPAIRGALARMPVKGRITVSGYEGSELLVARLLIESGAEVPYVGTACPRTPWSAPDLEWLQARGVHVQYRASLEQDIAAVREFRPTWPSAPRRWCRPPSRHDPGAVLHQPDLGAAADGPGRCRLAGAGGQRGHRQQGAASTDARLLRRRRGGDKAGVWEGKPVMRPEFRAETRRQVIKLVAPASRGDDLSLMLVLDHDRAGGYWGAVYVFTAIKGLQVVIDGPVGCENLPVTSVLHYTDALPPHELPIVVTGLAEEQLGREGTEGSMKRAHAALDPDLPSVVVTGSIAEMIGGGVTPEGTNIQRFLPRTIDEDQWQCANRAMYWLWTEYGLRKVPAAQALRRAPAGREAARQHHRPLLRHLQHAQRPGRDPPPGRGHRRRGEHGVPARQPPGRRAKLADADVNICMYREFGRMLCEALERPYLQAPIGLHSTTAFLREAGRAAEPRPRALHRAREAHHHQADLGPVALGHAGLLRHRQLRRRGRRNLRARHPPLPRRRDGPAVPLRGVAQARREDRQRRGAQLVHDKPPLVLFGSYNERMYLAETGAGMGLKPTYIPASFPGAIIRRHTGTPFMGYAGATYLVQEFCNALFDALFHILPLGTDLDRSRPRPRDSAERTALGRRRQALLARPRAGRAGAGADLGRQAPARPRRERSAPPATSASRRTAWRGRTPHCGGGWRHDRMRRSYPGAAGRPGRCRGDPLRLPCRAG
jgi:chlorophyllide a reductase subunit Z